jgi:hypothetical protein
LGVGPKCWGPTATSRCTNERDSSGGNEDHTEKGNEEKRNDPIHDDWFFVVVMNWAVLVESLARGPGGRVELVPMLQEKV